MKSSSIEQYQQQLQHSEPTLSVESIELNSEGLVNDIVIVNNHRVFRFPKHDWAIDHLWQEANCLALANQHLDMPLPQWTIYDGEMVGTPFVAYDWIPGKPLQQFEILQLPERDQDALAEQLATFLLQMHQIPMKDVEAAKIGRSVTMRSYDDWVKRFTLPRRTNLADGPHWSCARYDAGGEWMVKEQFSLSACQLVSNSAC